MASFFNRLFKDVPSDRTSSLPPPTTVKTPEQWKKDLSRNEYRVLRQSATERPGKSYDSGSTGSFACRGCGEQLFEAGSKFESGSGWPAFDDAIDGKVIEANDAGRTEILCAGCHGHLGHVFRGERMTQKSTRHCVNSLAIKYIPEE
jgi:peptide-methionine (R)-S-oxide reductase